MDYLPVRLIKAISVLVVALVALTVFASPVAAGQSTELAQAKAALLVRSDFPSGWTSHGGVSTSSGGGGGLAFFGGTEGAQQFATCVGGASLALLSLSPPTANGPTFQQGTRTVQEDVEVYPTQHEVQEAYALFASPKLSACMTPVMAGPGRQQIASSIGNGATVGTITVTTASSLALVPHSSGFTMSIPITGQGVTEDLVLTFIVSTRGRLVSATSLSGVGKPFPATLAHHIAAAAYRRL